MNPPTTRRQIAILTILLWGSSLPSLFAHGLVVLVTTPLSLPIDQIWLGRLMLAGMIVAGAIFLRMTRGFDTLRSFGTSFLVHLLFFLTFLGISAIFDNGSTAPMPGPGSAREILWGYDWKLAQTPFLIWNVTGFGVLVFAWAMILGFAEAIAESRKSAAAALVLVLLNFSWPFTLDASGPAGPLRIIFILGPLIFCFSRVFRFDQPWGLRLFCLGVSVTVFFAGPGHSIIDPFLSEWLAATFFHLLFPAIFLSVFWDRFRWEDLRRLPAAAALGGIFYLLTLAPVISSGAYCTGWHGSYARRWCPELREQLRLAAIRYAFFHDRQPPQGSSGEVFAALLPYLDREEIAFPETPLICPIDLLFSRNPHPYHIATGTSYPRLVTRGSERYATGTFRMAGIPYDISRRGWPAPLCLERDPPDALFGEGEVSYATGSHPLLANPGEEPLAKIASWRQDDAKTGPESVPPLFLAVRMGSLEFVQALLDAGASSTRQAWGNLTAVHLAAEADQATIALRLIEAGAKPDAEDLAGHTPLFLAAAKGSTQAVGALIARGAKPDKPFTSRLPDLSRGAIQDPRNGWTPLHAAAAGGHRETVEALLRAGAPLSARSSTNETALALAVRLQQREVAAILDLAGNP